VNYKKTKQKGVLFYETPCMLAWPSCTSLAVALAVIEFGLKPLPCKLLLHNN